MNKRARLDDDKTNPCAPLTEIMPTDPNAKLIPPNGVDYIPLTAYDLEWKEQDNKINLENIKYDYTMPEKLDWECKCVVDHLPKDKKNYIIDHILKWLNVK